MEVALYQALAAICPRTFPTVAPASTVRPYVTYQQIGGQATNYLDDTQPNLRNAYMQVNVWANDPLEAITMMQQIEAELRSDQNFIARPQGAFRSDYDHDMEVYGASQDFDIWRE